jgi:hypothetical protein
LLASKLLVGGECDLLASHCFYGGVVIHDLGYLLDRVNRGWKPRPQSKSLKLPPSTSLGSKEVSSSIKLAAPAAGNRDEN